MSINRVCISGGLTRDPELRMTQNGGQVLTFGVAVSDRRRFVFVDDPLMLPSPSPGRCS